MGWTRSARGVSTPIGVGLALFALSRFFGACNEAPLYGGSGGAPEGGITAIGGGPGTGRVTICLEQPNDGAGGKAASPDGGCTAPYKGVADGRSVIPLLVQTTPPPGDDAGAGGAQPVIVHLYVSDGTWLAPEGTASTASNSLDVAMVDGTSLPVAFIAGTAAVPVWVYASRGDDAASIFVDMAPATLTAVEATASQSVLVPGVTNSITLSAKVLAAGGALPSDGTLVTFTVVNPDTSVVADVYPATSAIDPTGAAAATLVVNAPDAGTSTVSVEVTALYPDGGQSDAAGQITITSP